ACANSPSVRSLWPFVPFVVNACSIHHEGHKSTQRISSFCFQQRISHLKLSVISQFHAPPRLKLLSKMLREWNLARFPFFCVGRRFRVIGNRNRQECEGFSCRASLRDACLTCDLPALIDVIRVD